MKEMNGSVILVRGSGVVAVTTDDAHLIGWKPRLDPEGASGSSLAGKAVAHGDADRISLGLQTKLSATTGGIVGRRHRKIVRKRLRRVCRNVRGRPHVRG